MHYAAVVLVVMQATAVAPDGKAAPTEACPGGPPRP